jgi:phosphinothricin acetyltransferase
VLRPTGPKARLLNCSSLSAPLTIRPAEPADAGSIAAIYNEAIGERQATFETRPRTRQEVAEWFDAPLPLLAAELDGEVVGFARIGPYSKRQVYAGIGEHGVYVAGRARRHGAGRALLEALAGAAEGAGLYKLTSRIFSTNEASIRLHEAVGFTIVGVQRHHGRLEGRWLDCVLVERLLGDAAAPSANSNGASSYDD